LAGLMAHASEKDIATLATRLKLPTAMTKFLKSTLVRAEKIKPDITLAAQKQILRRAGKELYIAAILVAAANTQNSEAYFPLFDLPKQWTPPEFPVSGSDLKAKGIE